MAKSCELQEPACQLSVHEILISLNVVSGFPLWSIHSVGNAQLFACYCLLVQSADASPAPNMCHAVACSTGYCATHTFDPEDYLWSWDIAKGGWKREVDSVDRSNVTNIPAPRAEVAAAVMPGPRGGATAEGSSGGSGSYGSQGQAVVHGGYTTAIHYLPGGQDVSMLRAQFMHQYMYLADTYIYDIATGTWKIVFCNSWPDRR